MNGERKIQAFKNHFLEFIQSLQPGAARKVYYILDMLKTQERLSEKFVKSIEDGIYEIRAEYNSNIYRVFFIFDEGNIVILFNGFQKKSQKTPRAEIEKAKQLKKEYYESKRK